MIVHMRKYRVLVHQESYPAFLEALAVLGIAHVETIRHDAPEAANQSLQRIWKKQVEVPSWIWAVIVSKSHEIL